MRSTIPYGKDIINRPVKMHDMVAYYRDSHELEDMIEQHQSNSGGYDYASYEDVKPHNLDNPPIQSIDRMQFNHGSGDPKVFQGFGMLLEEARAATEAETVQKTDVSIVVPTFLVSKV